MRRLGALLALASLLAPPGLPRAQQPRVDGQRPAAPRQEPQREPRTVIRRAVDLVLVDVQVLDRAGQPVKGLKLEQFAVLEDEKAQKIETFDYYDIEAIETAARTDEKPVVVSLGTVAPPAEVRQMVRDRRMIVLFFDLTSMQTDELLRAADAARRYVREQMTLADLVGVVAFGNRLAVLANFTNDRALLERAIGRILPGKEQQLAQQAEAPAPAGEETVTEETGAAFTPDETEFNIFNTDRKLAALQGVAELLRSIPGKKAIMHFTGGITQTGAENRSQLRAATEAANRANVSLYTVDVRGLQASAPGGDAATGAAAGTAMFSGAAVFRQASARQDSRDTLATLASDTGGRSFFDLGDFREVFEKVQEDASGYYLLGYYSTNAQRDGRWRRLRVRVDQPGVRLRYRDGYYAPKDYGFFNTEDRERQLEEAMRSETPRVEFPVALETAQFRLSAGEIFVPLAAKIASRALEWAEKRGKREVEFDFAAEVREARTGATVAALRDTVKVRLEAERFQQVAQRAILYQGGVILGPGHYRLKFLARENETGRVGTFEQELDLPPRETNRLQVSSLLLSSQIEAAAKTGEVQTKAFAPAAKLKQSPLEVAGERIIPSVTRVFTTQQRLYVLFQAYLPEKGDPARLRAGLVFFRNGEKASETPLVEPAEFDAKTRTAAFRLTLPLERLATGRYTVQAVVIESGGQHVAFARNYFALRPPASPSTAPGSAIAPEN